MADGNNNGNDQNNPGGGKNKGGGGNQGKEGLTLSGNINAAAMGSSWPAIKKTLADQTLNASGLIIAGFGIFLLKKAVYKMFSISDADVAPKPVSAYEGIGALYQLQKNNPGKFDQIKAKHPDLFGGAVIDVTPTVDAPAPVAPTNDGAKPQQSKGSAKNTGGK